MNDVLRTLREARPAELAPDAPVDAEVRRDELARAMAAPVGGTVREARVPRRSRVRPVWGLGLAGAVAAASVGVVAVTSGGGDGGAPGTPGHGARAGTSEQPMDARTVLLAAAEKLDTAAEPSGAYWHRTSTQTTSLLAGDPRQGGYRILARERLDQWLPGKHGGKVTNREQRLGVAFPTPADEAAWRRAGAPASVRIQAPGALGGKNRKLFPMSTAPGPVRTTTVPLADGEDAFWLGRNVTMKDLRGLPDDPVRLKRAVMRWYTGHDTEAVNVPMSADAWLFRVAGSLVTDLPVRPKVRAAAFRMLAGLKTVDSVGRVTDPQGRTGDGIGMKEKVKAGVLQHRLVIDPRSGSGLEDETVLLAPAPGAGAPAGTVLSSTVISMEWTDSAPK